jgi:hypothetical protein
VDSNKLKWISKYVSRPLFVVFFLILLVFIFYPKFFVDNGIDVKKTATGMIIFFCVKGTITSYMMYRSFVFLRNKKRAKKELENEKEIL